MDLMDFAGEDLYYDEAPSPEVQQLLRDAADHYGESEAENALYRAYFLAPEDLSVLVGLYRYFFYQHRLEEAMRVADRALAVVGRRLNMDCDWRGLDLNRLANAIEGSITLTRFYLSALKGAGYLKLRLGDPKGALERLRKVQELDTADRIGAVPLLRIAEEALQTQGA